MGIDAMPLHNSLPKIVPVPDCKTIDSFVNSKLSVIVKILPTNWYVQVF
jgi:hypothetical protein